MGSIGVVEEAMAGTFKLTGDDKAVQVARAAIVRPTCRVVRGVKGAVSAAGLVTRAVDICIASGSDRAVRFAISLRRCCDG